MIHFQVNRVGAFAIVALSLACAPANSSKQGAESGVTTSKDTAVVASAAAAKDSDGVKADLARIQGNPNAPVWVIEVSDFQCPYCKQWHDETYPTFRDEFVRTGKVRFAMASMANPDTNVGELCAELGISRQTLYRHVSPTGEIRVDGTRVLNRKGAARRERKNP